MHAEPLEILLAKTPSGFPSHPDLRDTLKILNDFFQIFGTVPEGKVFKECMQAADNWRTMTRHVYDIA